MLIDWFTVGAQIVNFIVLVWLLKRFLYKPVLDAIDAREKRVAAELANAAQQMSEAKRSRDELQAKGKSFDDERAALLAKAILDAKGEADRLSGNARQAAEALTLQRGAALQSESAKLSEAMSRLAAAESINIARAALKDLAGADLESRICEVFAHRLREIDSKTKESLGILFKSPAAEAVVASSFDLSPADKLTIQTALNESFSADIHLRFETSTNAIGGIEISVGGQRVSWTIGNYLKTLQDNFAALISAQSASVVVSAGKLPVRTPPLAMAEAAPASELPGAPVPAPASAPVPAPATAPAAAAA
jgi:F-type H+-transporting ATPase subunit b